MMLPVVWRARALDELDGVLDYIATSDRQAADGLHAVIERAVLLLGEHPYLGRPGRKDGMREFVAHPNYIIIYRVLADRLEITSVVHSRRRYP
jgi:toxin ParE1/3/4